MARVTILNSHGLKLAGELEETSGSKDLCILSHGFRSSKHDPSLLTLSKALTGAGLCTYRFDFTGNGESDGELAYGAYWREVDDLRSVVNYFRFRGWRIVSLIGHSKGGNAVLLYASKYGDVDCIVNMCGRFDMTRGMETRLRGKKGLQKLRDEGVLDIYSRSGKFEFRVTKSDLEERMATDMHKACLQIPNHCRVLNIHGSADEAVETEDVYEFGKRIQYSIVHVIDGADHNFSSKQEEVAKVVVDFVLACYKQQAPLRASL